MEIRLKTKEEVLQHLHYIKERKRQHAAEARAQYQALQKETEQLKNQIYATIES